MTSSIARRYTSVFPLPVTPWSKNGANLPFSTASFIFPHAISWSIVSAGVCPPLSPSPPNGSLDISSCSVTDESVLFEPREVRAHVSEYLFEIVERHPAAPRARTPESATWSSFSLAARSPRRRARSGRYYLLGLYLRVRFQLVLETRRAPFS